MSDFESAVLVIYKHQMYAAYLSPIVAGIAIFPALYALFQLISQVKISRLNTLLLLEQDMSQRRDRLSTAATKLKEIEGSEEYKTNPKALEPFILLFNEARENYLNSLDRLCFCIIKNAFEEKDIRPDYRDVLKQAISDFKDQFGPGTSFRHILSLHNKWAET